MTPARERNTDVASQDHGGWCNRGAMRKYPQFPTLKAQGTALSDVGNTRAYLSGATPGRALEGLPGAGRGGGGERSSPAICSSVSWSAWKGKEEKVSHWASRSVGRSLAGSAQPPLVRPVPHAGPRQPTHPGTSAKEARA